MTMPSAIKELLLSRSTGAGLRPGERPRPSLLRPTHDEPDDDTPSLLHDKSGAIMILGLFMAVFLVGILYYMVGIGDAIFYRERMQDVSDAGAFTAAVMNARGMNLLTLLNIVMAVVLGILIALKIIELILAAALVIAFAVNIVCFGCASGVVAMLTNAQIQLRRVINKMERIVTKIIKALHAAQKVIRSAWPFLSQLRAVDAMSFSETFKPPAIFGFVWPIWAALPTEDGSFNTTCDKAGEYVGDLVGLPFRAIGGTIGNKLADWISSAVEGMVSAMKAYFCGTTGGGTPPTLPPITEDHALPASALSNACREGCAPPNNTPSQCDPCAADIHSTSCQSALETVCTDAGTEQRDSRPGANGCDSATDQAACNALAQQARTECRPASGRALKNYSYMQEYAYMLHWQTLAADGTTCVINGDPTTPAELNATALRSEFTDRAEGSGAGAPCSRSDWVTGISSPWGAVCKYDTPPENDAPGFFNCTSLPTSRADALSRVRSGSFSKASEVQLVSEVFSCIETKETTFPPPTLSGAPDASSRKPPQRVKCRTPAGTGCRDWVELGDEDFQLRAFAFGEATPNLGERGVGIATWGNSDAADGFSDTIAEVGRISVAQAEFYWAGDAGEPRIEWMWHMSWRARLRRVRLPRNVSSLSSACTGQSGGSASRCGSMSSFALGMLSVH